MSRDDRADFPISDNGIEYRIHVLAKLLALAKRQLIVSVARKDMFLVEEARPPIRPRVVYVLRTRLATRTGCARAAPARSKIARRIAQAFRVGVSDLSFESATHALLQNRLQRIVALAGVGHVCARQRSVLISLIERPRSAASRK